MYVTLNNGIKMPQIGLGVFKVDDGSVVENSVKKALETGYRSIDTAAIYGNETGVGNAIKEVAREELFITTKVWNGDQGYDSTLKALDESLDKLGLDYVDLYLVHWPMPQVDKYVETYRALEKLYKDGKTRAIGVSNFHIPHLERILNECTVVPTVNQIECHPFLNQLEIRDFCKKHNIFVEAWAPIMKGGDILNNEVLVNISQKYSKTPAQVILRWHIQNDVIVIPKSITPSRIEENFNIFDFELDSDDMTKISALNCDQRTGSNPDDMNKH